MSADFLHAHPYLLADLAGLAIVALCWLCAGSQRRMMLLSGAIFAPFFPIAGLFSDGSYWTPSHVELGSLSPILVLGGPIGIEDLLFLFIAGARAWFFATATSSRRWIATAAPAVFLRRAFAMTACAFASLALYRVLGFGYASASYVLPAAFGAFLLCSNRRHWPLAVGGALGSAALAGLELRVWFAIWPDYRNAWTPNAATSHALLGVPVGDLLWWAVVGAVHPLVMARCAGVVRRASATDMPASRQGPQ